MLGAYMGNDNLLGELDAILVGGGGEGRGQPAME